jgi:hypothetical protein
LLRHDRLALCVAWHAANLCSGDFPARATVYGRNAWIARCLLRRPEGELVLSRILRVSVPRNHYDGSAHDPANDLAALTHLRHLTWK